MHKTTRAVVGAIAAAAFVGPISQAPSAHAAGCAEGYTTEDGSCAAPVRQDPLTADQKAQRSDKAARLKALTASLRAGDGLSAADTPGNTQAAPANLPAPDGGYYDYAEPEVANMYIYKEGEGDGKKSYTCGPAATRNMVAAMYKYRQGSYQDFGEAQFSAWEGTTTSGTARANIAAALNNHFSQFGSWTTSRPSSKADLLAAVANDTKWYHQSVILNVDTVEYSWFNGKHLNHFDFSYGFNNTGSKDYVKVAEEWDPIYIYGSSDYGNPYGLHPLTLLADTFQAVTSLSNHGIVS